MIDAIGDWGSPIVDTRHSQAGKSSHAWSTVFMKERRNNGNICCEVFSVLRFLSKQRSIMKCDVDIRKDLYANVVLSGGTTMFPGPMTA